MSEFVDFLHDVFSDFGTISTRKMFGGYGVYHNGVMFALIADDTLFLKADESIAHHFSERDLPQFEYPKGGKMIKMSYYQAPEELFEDGSLAAEWAGRSHECALRNQKKKR